MTVFPLQFAKSSILWNPILLILKNKTVDRIPFNNLIKLKFYFLKFYAAGTFHLNRYITYITTRNGSTSDQSFQ